MASARARAAGAADGCRRLVISITAAGERSHGPTGPSSDGSVPGAGTNAPATRASASTAKRRRANADAALEHSIYSTSSPSKLAGEWAPGLPPLSLDHQAGGGVSVAPPASTPSKNAAETAESSWGPPNNNNKLM